MIEGGVKPITDEKSSLKKRTTRRKRNKKPLIFIIVPGSRPLWRAFSSYI
jgi:hypothetical protein